MKIFLTGATGYIGRTVALRLLGEGHQIAALTRNPQRAQSALGSQIDFVDATEGPAALGRGLAGAGAVINLSGEAIEAKRWTARRKRVLWDSRVTLTRALVDAIARSPTKPAVLISASGVDYYGDRAADPIDETAGPGKGFMPELCQAWEAAADRATTYGMRVVKLRIAPVLGPESRFIGKLLPLFRSGFGMTLGTGRQIVPWVHLDDLVEIIVRALADDRFSGPLNAVSPEPVSFRQLARTLGEVLHRPVGLRVPAPLIRIGLGELSQAVLSSKRALPSELQRLGFGFRYPQLQPAVEDSVARSDIGCVIGPLDDARQLPDTPYLRANPPRYLLRQVTRIDAPIGDVFAFFSDASNLGAITPPALGFQLQTPPPIAIGEGATIDYRVKLGPWRLRWRSRIELWEPGRRFADVQERGPYRCWWHEHQFRQLDGQTVMEDHVYYAPPLGPLGRLANKLFVAPQLRRIFSYRAHAVAQRFGKSLRAPARAA